MTKNKKPRVIWGAEENGKLWSIYFPTEEHVLEIGRKPIMFVEIIKDKEEQEPK